MTENWTKRILYFAGSWNVVGGVSALLSPEQHFAQMYVGALQLEDPLQAFFFRATWINVVAWGLGYILAAKLPTARQTILAAGGAGKLAYFVACLSLFRSGTGNEVLLAAGIFDVAFALVFVSMLWRKEVEPWMSQA
jgi:hypothetical protein